MKAEVLKDHLDALLRVAQAGRVVDDVGAGGVLMFGAQMHWSAKTTALARRQADLAVGATHRPRR